MNLLLVFLLIQSVASIRPIYNQPANIETCSRETSRIARQLVKSKILEIAKTHSIPLSSNCPFQPALDLYLEHETNGKEKTYRGYWQCPYSGKSFKSEQYIDYHLKKYWKHKINNNATECLASWCGILECHNTNGIENRNRNRNRNQHQHSNPTPTQNEAILKTNQEHHNEHKCRAVLHTCFPPSNGIATRNFQDQLFDTLCSTSSRSERQLKQQQLLASQSNMSATTILWYIFVIITTFATLIFYTCYYLQLKDGKVDDILQRRDMKRKGSKFF